MNRDKVQKGGKSSIWNPLNRILKDDSRLENFRETVDWQSVLSNEWCSNVLLDRIVTVLLFGFGSSEALCIRFEGSFLVIP